MSSTTLAGAETSYAFLKISLARSLLLSIPNLMLLLFFSYHWAVTIFIALHGFRGLLLLHIHQPTASRSSVTSISSIPNHGLLYISCIYTNRKSKCNLAQIFVH